MQRQRRHATCTIDLHKAQSAQQSNHVCCEPSHAGESGRTGYRQRVRLRVEHVFCQRQQRCIIREEQPQVPKDSDAGVAKLPLLLNRVMHVLPISGAAPGHRPT